MSIYRVVAPDLAPLEVGGATLQLMESLGFSEDSRSMLVRVTFTDESDPGQLHYAVWLYDLTLHQYTRCLNTELGVGTIDVKTASIVGSGTSAVILAETAVWGGAPTPRLILFHGINQVTDVISTLFGQDVEPPIIERYALSDDGRFLAVQTDSTLLAPVDAPDTNDQSDIYLIDLLTQRIERVSFVGKSEVNKPTFLGDIAVQNGVVQVAFSTDAAFSNQDKNSLSELPGDVYLWSSAFDSSGVVGTQNFELISASQSGSATGGTDLNAPVIATSAGLFFNSLADDLVLGDGNLASDAFLRTSDGDMSRLTPDGIDELMAGAAVLSTSGDGRVVTLLTSSEEIVGTSGTQQLLVLDRITGTWHVVSDSVSGNMANDIVISGLVSPKGSLVAFTSAASNLVEGEAATMQGDLYISDTELPVNIPPTGSVSITGVAKQGQTLTASNTLADTDGLGAITYTWYASGSDTPIGSGNTYTLTQAEVGKAITVTASYTDGQGTAESKTSSPTVAVANVNEQPTGAVTIAGTATQGQTLTASNTLADTDGLGTIAYQWQADGVAIGGATADSYTLTQAEVGKTITVTASYVDGYGAAESKMSDATTAVANANDLPTGSVSITGKATQGQTLAAANTLADADGLGAITYQWQADGVAIGGATADRYTLTQAEVGKTITVTASYTDGYGMPESVASSETAPVLPSGNGTLGGRIYHWKSHALLSGASITIGAVEGDPAVGDLVGQTGENGSYAFDALLEGQYDLQASKTLTALETGSVINSADALAALKLAVGRNPNVDPDGEGPLTAAPVSPYQFIAADVNQDGKVSSADALAILKMAVKRSDAPPREWLFVPEGEDFWNETTGTFTTTRSSVIWDKDGIQLAMPGSAEANYVAVLKGDVNGSWVPPSGSQVLADSYFAGLQADGLGPLTQWGMTIV